MVSDLCIASSDWHLERNAWVRHPALSGDAYYGLSQIVDICVSTGLPLLAAGDLFDKPYPDSRSVALAISQMDRMKSAGLNVYFTQGQHEMAKDWPWLGLHSWPTWTHKAVVDLGRGVTLAGLDYTKPHLLDKALNDLLPAGNGVRLFMCHQVWGDFMGSCVVADGHLSQVPLEGGLILTGDYHRHKQLAVKRGGHVNVALSPGSICLQSVDEPADKFVYLIKDDLSYESLPLKSRQVFHRELLTEEDLDAFLSGLDSGWLAPQSGVPEEISRPILAVRFNPDIKDIFKHISESVGSDRAHLFMRPVSRELKLREVEVGPVDATIQLGLEGNLSKLCDPSTLTHAIAKRLLNSDNPVAELEVIENEYLKERDEL